MNDFAVQELTLGQLLENTAARFPDSDAVIHADRDLRQTWSEFSACVDEMARGLMAIGVRKGEKVAVWATNVPHWVTLMFATARIGAATFFIALICAFPPTRDTDTPGFTAGITPEWNSSVSRKIWPSVMEMTFVGI